MIDGIATITSDLSATPVPPMANAMAALTSRMTAASNVNAIAQDFEAMFATQLLEPMFKTVAVNDAFGGGHGEEAMRTFLVQEYGNFIAKTGMLGISAQVKNVMLRAQESAESRKSASTKDSPSLWETGRNFPAKSSLPTQGVPTFSDTPLLSVTS